MVEQPVVDAGGHRPLLTDALEIGELGRGQEALLVAAWREVFARGGESWSRAHLAWEARADARRVVARRGARIVAHACGRPARTWIDGREQVFTHVGDVFVRPEERRGLARDGLAARTVRALLERCEQAGDAIVFGWPIRSHARLGRRLLGYRKVMSQLVLGKALSRAPQAPPEIATARDFGQDARWLWERCAAEHGASTVRDAGWLRWRYLERPGGGYRPLVFRDGAGCMRGLCVLAPPGRLGAGVALLADWLVPADEDGIGELLLRAAECHALELGARALAACIPAWSPWFARFQDAGWRVHVAELELHARAFLPRFEPAFLRERWWYQPGDGDWA